QLFLVLIVLADAHRQCAGLLFLLLVLPFLLATLGLLFDRDGDDGSGLIKAVLFRIVFVENILIACLQIGQLGQEIRYLGRVGVGLDWFDEFPAIFILFQHDVLAGVLDLDAASVGRVKACHMRIAQGIEGDEHILELVAANLENLLVVLELGVTILLENRLESRLSSRKHRLLRTRNLFGVRGRDSANKKRNRIAIGLGNGQ